MDPCTCTCSCCCLQQTSASCSNIHTYIQVRHIASINLLYRSELKMCQDNFHFLFVVYVHNLPTMSPLQSLSSPRGSGSIREESSAAGSGVLCGEVSSGQ